MTENKMTRHADDAAERAKVRDSRDNVPLRENITESTKTQGFFIKDSLLKGEENAMKERDLIRNLGFSSRRAFHKELERERLAGACILAKSYDGGGYFLPSDGEKGKAELKRYILTVSARARHSFRSLKAARRALQEYE